MGESRKRAVIASASLDFPSIAADGTAEMSFTDPDAKAGGIVALGPPAFLDVGLTATAYINAADEIVVRLHNTTAAAIDPTAGAQAAVAAVGTMVIGEPVTDGDTFTIGTKVYTLQDTLTDVDGNIEIGVSEATAKANIVSAINLTGTPGTDYATLMTIHPDVTATAFATDDGVLTAKVAGFAGNAIALAESFTHVSNIIENDAVFLGDTTLGADAITAADASYDVALIV